MEHGASAHVQGRMEAIPQPMVELCCIKPR